MADTLGFYLKELEGEESSRKAVLGKPLVARLDGRAFHTFTRGLKRPFDPELTALMQNTTKYLVEETGALVGYTQSDEITLIWWLPEGSESQYLFDGRYQKLASVLSGTASAYFNKYLAKFLPSKADELPVFDARVFQTPELKDAYLALLWREKDAIKNSITMLALAHFSSKELHKVNGDVKKEMVRAKGDPWEDYPSSFRKGSYFMRVPETRELSPEDLEKIPERHRPHGPVTRNTVKQVELPDLRSLTEEEGVSLLFG